MGARASASGSMATRPRSTAWPSRPTAPLSPRAATTGPSGCGDHGPERRALENLSRSLGLADQVSFAGKIPTDNVSKLLAEHNILIVPSIWNEGFGVVALEGIASGCVVIGSNSGGLPEAIGKCGLVVRTGDAEALARAIKRALTESDLTTELRSNAADHLARHLPACVAERYLTVISQALLR